MLATFEIWLLRVVAFIVLLAVVAAGSILAYKHFFEAGPAPVVESAAPAVKQADGSVIEERAATAPDTKPFNALPKGAKLIRRESVTVQPRAQPAAPGQAAGPLPLAVTTNLDLDRMADGTERVVASSPDGQVTGAIDIPVAPPTPAPPKWAAGVAYGIPMGGVRSEGVWVERDVWRVRLGLEANHVSAARENSNVVVMRVGVSF
jgi:hypothetical protein